MRYGSYRCATCTQTVEHKTSVVFKKDKSAVDNNNIALSHCTFKNAMHSHRLFECAMH